MAKGILIAAALASFLALSGCEFGEPYLSVLRGNYAYQQGKYPEATLRYLSALETGEHAEWISYDLGNVYHALGEVDAALEIWDAAESASDSELRYRLRFNRGTLFYELGRYREAYDEFRAALGIDPVSVEAKVNLELSLQKIDAANRASAGQRTESAAVGRGERGDAERVLEYVRRKEEERWSSGAAELGESSPRDW